jgi:hypothetical protein
LRIFSGQQIELSEVWDLSWRYLGRFFTLGLVAALVLLPFGIIFYVVAVGAALASRPPGETASEAFRHVRYWPSALIFVIPTIVVDFGLTFVTPALAYTTASIDRARRIGLSMVRTTWPENALYVLFPPLALQLVANLPFSIDRGSRLLLGASSLVVVLLNLVAKGATAAFYLRRTDVVGTGSLAGEGSAPRAAAETA